MKPVFHHACTVIRRQLLRTGTLSLATGDARMTGEQWVTRPCGAPLFGDEAHKTGVCASCAAGWAHPNNYRVEGSP